MTLTEQWKKGELEAGWYYVKNEFGNIFISEYSENYDYIGDKVVKDFFTEVSEITKVLAPVPSYEEYSRLEWYAGCGPDRIVELNKENRQLRKWCEEFNALEVAKENQQLKELLISAKDIIEWYSTESGYIDLPTKDLLTQIDEVLK